ncbi:MAG TPA: 4-alpha-glucanotransferase [Acidimicrobiales bacterium]|nr:4-alpha-glucanotransferase [Acidimicrobiales bacterium]
MTATHHPGRGGRDRWGVAHGYHDYAGQWRDAPAETLQAIHRSMGAVEGDPPPPRAVTVRTDHQLPDIGHGRVVTEDGGEIEVAGALPAGLPVGYHRFEPPDGVAFPLIVSPGRVPLPGGREWGFAAQLYAARSSRSWGIGDLGDLGRINSWARGLGAGFTLVNPLHAPTPGARQQASPYFPGSRCFLNPIYIAVEDVPGASGAQGLETAAAAGHALNRDRRLDRDRVWELKQPVLESIFRSTREDAGFSAYRRRRGSSLERFAIYCAVAEVHGPTWRDWPEGAESSAREDRVSFHAWLQWVAEAQAEAAHRELGLVVDLAVGVDPTGPDSWIWRDTFAEGMSVGAPPDEFNTQGQDWGLPPFDPWRLRSAGYEPWIEALRSNMTHGAGLRVDHVMGLFRLYWIPRDSDARAGAYVYYHHHDMLNILALEADRAGAYVVGEDLGTVEDEVRRDLGERQVLSYRVWWFEDGPTDSWPEAAMGAVTTHDLPTVAGVLTGSDLQAQREIGTEPNEESSAALVRKLRERAPGDDPEQVIAGVYEDLSRAPCRLLVATLDDVLAVEERPNMPGTTDAWPNWCIGLPEPLEVLEKAPLAARVAASLGRGGGG